MTTRAIEPRVRGFLRSESRICSGLVEDVNGTLGRPPRVGRTGDLFYGPWIWSIVDRSATQRRTHWKRWNWVDETARRGSSADHGDEYQHFASEVAGSNPVFRSFVAGQAPFFNRDVLLRLTAPSDPSLVPDVRVLKSRWCLCAAQVRTKRCTRLIGQCDRDHARFERYLTSQSRREEEATQGLASVLDEELDLWSRQPHAIDAP